MKREGEAVSGYSEFRYLGKTFKPYKKLRGGRATFEAISRRLQNNRITPKRWNWEKFYQAAAAADPRNKEVDLFLWEGRVVIPCSNYLFEYREE